jgi:uroporphyrin-III C-methyltransferase
VFYMAGRQLGRLARQLQAAGWPAGTAVAVVSRAGCADAVASDHRLDGLAAASVLHAGRPAVVTVGVAARAVAAAPQPRAEADAAPARRAALAA